MENIETGKITGEILQLVSFKIGDEIFGVDILNVQEINKIMEITGVPNTPEYIMGVVNLRGKIIPVVDLRVKLKFDKQEFNNNTRIVVVEIGSNIVGFIVDEVQEVLRVPKNILESPPDIVSGIDSDYITAIGRLEDKLLIILELEKVLSLKEVKELEKI